MGSFRVKILRPKWRKCDEPFDLKAGYGTFHARQACTRYGGASDGIARGVLVPGGLCCWRDI